MGFFEPSVMGGGGHHNLVVIALMIIKFAHISTLLHSTQW